MSDVHGSITVEVLEPAEKVLIRRYRDVVYSRQRLSASEKLFCLLHLHEDPHARRNLIRHYLPLAYHWARRVKGGTFMKKIETGNRVIIENLEHDRLRPEDDMDFFLSRQVRKAIQSTL